MKKIVTTYAALLLSTALIHCVAASPSITVTGGAHTPVSLVPEQSSGLGAVFVVDTSGGASVTATYTPQTPGASVTWSRFSTLGGGVAVPVEKASGYILSDLTPDMGYIVTEGNRQFCFWVTDYASRPFRLDGAKIAESDCTSVVIVPDGKGDRMTYYSVNGRAIEIDRDIHVTYTTLDYDSDYGVYAPKEVTEKFAWLRPELHVVAPLTDTRFKVDGDRFLRAWGLTAEAETETCVAVTVDARVNAVQSEHVSAENEQKADGDMLGGSAPVEIEFNAAVTDAALFTEWQFASDPEFTDINLRFADPVITYSFRESGVTYIRFYAANASGSCDYVSDTFEVKIGESDLRCPNAFSPGNSDGVNDEWRVSYKSIVEFDCSIFTRTGRRVAHLTEPSQGWDGKIGGKPAPPGVYYYVIKATGSDGHVYNLSGDINIIGFR